MRTLLRQGADRLSARGIAAGGRDAEVLLGHALGGGRERLVGLLGERAKARCDAVYESLLQRRLVREPVAYIVGRKEFWSLDFRVTPAVLIPRPETELLVDIALERALERASPLRIIDIGTGSGAIAVALASELSQAVVLATDISAAALALAQGNAERNHVADRIRFLQCDLFAGLAPHTRFDLILANPPYVCSDDIARLEPEVAFWEPRGALDGGADGLDFYRRLAGDAPGYLAREGALVVEIGAGTAAEVRRIFERATGWDDLSVHNDYAGLERAVVARPGSR